MRILGIDPGYAICGYAVLDYDDTHASFEVVDFGTFQSPCGMSFPDRLLIIYQGLSRIIRLYQPHVMAIEELFFSRNTTTAIATGQARGVLILAAAQVKLQIYEYKPVQVKKAVTGYGRAEKKQVQLMVQNILHLAELPKPDDAADALALAICQAYTGPRPDYKLKGAYNYDYSLFETNGLD